MLIQTKMDAVRSIISNHQADKIDGVLIDVSTAVAINTVYEALNDSNKTKYHSKDISIMGAIAWKLVGKNGV